MTAAAVLDVAGGGRPTRQLAHLLASALGDGPWSVSAEGVAAYACGDVSLLRERDGARLRLSLSGSLLQVDGVYPLGVTTVKEDRAVIDINQDIACVARDVARGVLAAYLPRYERAVDERLAMREIAGVARELRAAVAASDDAMAGPLVNGRFDFLGLAVTDDAGRPMSSALGAAGVAPVRGEITVAADRTSEIHLRGVPRDLALRLCRELGACLS